jgi:hypothetical protein
MAGTNTGTGTGKRKRVRVKGKLVLTSRALLAQTTEKLQTLGRSVQELRALVEVKEQTVLNLRDRLDKMGQWRAQDAVEREGLAHKLAIIYAMANGHHDTAIISLLAGPRLANVLNGCNDVVTDARSHEDLALQKERDTVMAQRIENERIDQNTRPKVMLKMIPLLGTKHASPDAARRARQGQGQEVRRG